ncbi:ABC transporter substrate-binding protein [Bosea sp. RCC_152_1]|uniref:ABC transporter substrate-binding protein n=1 Tax=Bosea sp. RCC_152_1 TaxID=3239228 RepID=UPI003523D94F
MSAHYPSRRQLLAAGGLLVLTPQGLVSEAVAQAQLSSVPKRGGVLTAVIDPEPTALLSAVNVSGPTSFVSPKVHEGLLDYDFDLTPKPQLATAWDVSEDGLTYRFELRRGVKWHDGRDFTAEDVAFSLLFLKQHHAHNRSTFANLAEVRTPDPHTAIVVFSKPAPYFLTALIASQAPIIAKHVFEGKDPVSNPAHNAPIGTGPFVFKEWQRGSHILYERNPNYWDQPKPYVDRLIVRVVTDLAARAVALESGTADIAGDNPVPLAEVGRFAAIPQLGVEERGSAYSGDINQLVFNLDNPYLKDVRVRQAIAHAIDKKAYLDIVWYGYGDIANGPVVPALKQWHATDLPAYKFDPKRAEALLDEAGLKRGGGGVRFRLTNDYLPYGDNFKRGSEFIKQALARIGIEVTIRGQDFASYIRRVYTDRDFDFANAWLGNYFDPTVGVQRLFWTKNIKKGTPFSNGANYSNPDVDALFEAAAIEPDLSKRQELFRKVQHLLVRDLPHHELVAQKNITVFNKRVKNHTVSANGLRANFADLYLEA